MLFFVHLTTVYCIYAKVQSACTELQYVVHFQKWNQFFFNRKYGNKPEARLSAIDPDQFRILASPKTLFQTGQTANLGMNLLLSSYRGMESVKM